MCRLITLIDFLLDHSTQIFRISDLAILQILKPLVKQLFCNKEIFSTVEMQGNYLQHFSKPQKIKRHNIYQTNFHMRIWGNNNKVYIFFLFSFHFGLNPKTK